MNDKQVDLRLLEWTGRVLTVFGDYSGDLTLPMWVAVDCEVEALRSFIREHHMLPDGTKRWEKSERTIAGVTVDVLIKAASELLGVWSSYNTEPGSMSWLIAQTYRAVHDKLKDPTKHVHVVIRDGLGHFTCAALLDARNAGYAEPTDLDAAQEQGRINELEAEVSRLRQELTNALPCQVSNREQELRQGFEWLEGRVSELSQIIGMVTDTLAEFGEEGNGTAAERVRRLVVSLRKELASAIAAALEAREELELVRVHRDDLCKRVNAFECLPVGTVLTLHHRILALEVHHAELEHDGYLYRLSGDTLELEVEGTWGPAPELWEDVMNPTASFKLFREESDTEGQGPAPK